MTYQDFLGLLDQQAPPQECNALLQAMWFDANDDWENAHNLSQDVHSSQGAWVHAYLHRKEGDLSNARYWYTQANKQEFKGSLTEESEEIIKALLL